MPLQKKFNNEKWSFYHNLSSPNQKIVKKSIWKFLDLSVPIFGPRSGRNEMDLRYVKL